MKTHQFQAICGAMNIKEENRITIVQGGSLGGSLELMTINHLIYRLKRNLATLTRCLSRHCLHIVIPPAMVVAVFGNNERRVGLRLQKPI
jgi:hypothetical protein